MIAQPKRKIGLMLLPAALPARSRGTIVAPHTTVIWRQLANCPPRSSSKNGDISSSTTLLFERHSGTRARAPWSERCRRKGAAAHDHLRVCFHFQRLREFVHVGTIL